MPLGWVCRRRGREGKLLSKSCFVGKYHVNARKSSIKGKSQAELSYWSHIQPLVAPGWNRGQHIYLSQDVTDLSVFSGLLLGKEHHDHPSGPSVPPPLPSLSCMPVPVPAASHAKTGSKDSSTQTDKTAELFWPATASFPGRGRLGTTPSHSPAPRPLGTRVASEKLGELCQGKMSAPLGLSAIPRDTLVLMGARWGYVMLPQFVRYSGGFFKETKI